MCSFNRFVNCCFSVMMLVFGVCGGDVDDLFLLLVCGDLVLCVNFLVLCIDSLCEMIWLVSFLILGVFSSVCV